jgi:hypothetical protein
MAQFRGTIRGQRGEASRLGSKSSGLCVTCNGWNGGITVYVDYDKNTGKDRFQVFRTGGSRNKSFDGDGCLAEFETEG